MKRLAPYQLAHLKEKAVSDFKFFTRCIVPPDWFDDEFHVQLCNFLQAKRTQKLVILPRTHLKTTICSTIYPLWRASINPNIRVLIVSNTAPNAEKTLHSIRAIVESNKNYQLLFPECIPEFNRVRWSDRCACLQRKEDYPEGTFESAGVNTAIIRRHYNLIVEDDTVAPKKDDLTGQECMPSREDIEQAVGFHKLTPPLLINEDDETLVVGCLVGNTKVLLSDGRFKCIKDVFVKDTVVSFTNGKPYMCKVSAVIPQGKSSVLEVKTNNSRVVATPNHPFLSWDGSQFVFVRADALKEGNFIVAYVKKYDGIIYTFPSGLETDDNLMWLIGYMYGDGWVSFTHKERNLSSCNVFVTKSEYEDLNEKVKRLFYHYFEAVLKSRGNGVFQVTNREAGDVFLSLGLDRGTKNKTIPDWVFMLPYTQRRSFIRGLLDADGYKVRIGEWGIELSNKVLVEQIKLLGITSGFSSSNIHYRSRLVKVPLSKNDILSETWHIHMYDVNTQHNKDKRYKTEFNYLPLAPEFGLEKVKSVMEVGEEEVYDLTVEETHNFIANGLVVHNTRWASYDHINYILENQKYAVFDKPAISEDGKPLYKRFSMERLEAIRLGLGSQMFCNPAEAPILMADFTSKPLKDIKVGDEVVGFTLCESVHKERTKLVKTKVIAKGSRFAPVCKVYMSSGRIIRCTKEHQWLANLRKARDGHHPAYRTIESSGSGCRRLTLHYICDPYVEELSAEKQKLAEWLAGVYDGEGHCTKHLVLSQNQKVHPEVYAKMLNVLKELDFKFGVYEKPGDKGNMVIYFGTNRKDRRRFLLQVDTCKKQPIIDSLYQAHFCEEEDDVLYWEIDKSEEVFWLQTESGNYVCWGYASKNSSLYLNKPLAREYMTFKPEWVQYYEESELPEDGSCIVTVDPADPPTGNKSQDYSGIVSCKHSKKGIYVRRYRRERLTDHQIICAALDIAEMDGAYKIRVEIDRYAHLQFGFKEEMSRRRKYFSIDAVKTRGKQKNARIRDRLQPMFENGVIKLKRGMRELEEELFQFPDGSHDDLIDALAWQVEQISPTEVEIPKFIQKRRLPTVGEMYDTLLKRGRATQYPFQKQLLLERPNLWK